MTAPKTAEEDEAMSAPTDAKVEEATKDIEAFPLALAKHLGYDRAWQSPKDPAEWVAERTVEGGGVEVLPLRAWITRKIEKVEALTKENADLRIDLMKVSHEEWLKHRAAMARDTELGAVRAERDAARKENADLRARLEASAEDALRYREALVGCEASMDTICTLDAAGVLSILGGKGSYYAEEWARRHEAARAALAPKEESRG